MRTREISPEQLRAMTRKGDVLRLRVAKNVKEEIEVEAKRRGMTASAYLLWLHAEAMGRGRADKVKGS